MSTADRLTDGSVTAQEPKDLLDSDSGPLIADNSWLNALFIPSCIDDMELSTYAFRVLCHLKRRADHSGKAFPGMRSIAKKCCLSVSTVCRAVKELQSRGVLHVQERGENVSNLYLLTNPDEWKAKDGKPFNHPNKTRPPKGEALSIGNRAVSDRNERVSNRRESKEGNPKKAIQKETTTTTHAREGAPTKAGPPVGEALPSSFSSVSGGSEKPTGHLSPQDRLELGAIANDFGSDSRQKAKAAACAKRRGMTFVREQAEIVRSNPKIENPAGAFEAACDSPEGWKRRKAVAKKAARRKTAEPKPEEPPPVQPDHSEDLNFWRGLSRDERRAWKAIVDPGNVWRKVTEDTENPGNVFLGALAAIRKGQQTEAAAKLAQEVACAATVLVNAQQPAEAAA